jgi:ferredoxin/flavodoxin---NADP+ reductase
MPLILCAPRRAPRSDDGPMTFVITQRCCNDASCVSVCPVNCIHPAPGEPGFLTAEMLYIDPEACIECAACMQVCPVDAIRPEQDLDGSQLQYRDINAKFYEQNPMSTFGEPVRAKRPDVNARGLRVAIVGSGPAGSYAAAALLERAGVEVDLYERLLTPHGLIRFGIAPDHPHTKNVVTAFPYGSMRGLRLHLGVEVGVHVTHEELIARHHAVIYAVGASGDRPLDIPGEDLRGSLSAAQFVAWYNGHPEQAGLQIDLSRCDRAIVIGNGNVALDMARILVSEPGTLANTDIADHSLRVLRDSAIREVVLLARRGIAQAAYTTPELLALLDLPGVSVVVDPAELVLDPHTAQREARGELDAITARKIDIVRHLANRPAGSAGKRIVLRFLLSPAELSGNGRVEGIRAVRNEFATDDGGQVRAEAAGDAVEFPAQLVLRSIGYRGTALPGLPFDEKTGTIPNKAGRVQAESGRMPGTYVTGWIKRGPTGVVGTNKHCAGETVDALVEDWASGRLPAPSRLGQRVEVLLEERGVRSLDLAAWGRIDLAERAAGSRSGRPRVKIVNACDLVAAGQDRGAMRK